MTAIYSVTDGVDDFRAQDVNQYGDTFANVLGVTDTQQDALGRLVIPAAASAPSSPTEGQVYRSTADGLMYVYNGSAWVKWGPIRKTERFVLGANVVLAQDASRTTLFSETFATTGGSTLIMASLHITATKTATAEGAVILAELERWNAAIGDWVLIQPFADARYLVGSQVNRLKAMFCTLQPVGSVGGDSYRIRAARDSRYADATCMSDSDLFLMEIE